MANCEFSLTFRAFWLPLTDAIIDYNVVVNGKEHKDLIWWYKYPTSESAPIAGHMCFYNEKVQIYVDGIEEK